VIGLPEYGGASSLPFLTLFSANSIRPGVVEKSGLSAHSDVFAEASADTEASVKSFSAAFWGSVRLSRFAKRSVLAASVAPCASSI
jgi:hypothetical protein